MSKKNDKTPKNYSDYSYTGEETITMSVQDFTTLRKGLEKALNNGVKIEYPQIVRWFDLEKGQPIDKPTTKQIKEDKVREFADNEATFSKDNQRISYEPNIFPEIYNALQTGMKVHMEMVDAGVAKPLSEVKKHFEDRSAKGQMKVQDDEPNAPMGVVKDEPEAEESGEEDKQ